MLNHTRLVVVFLCACGSTDTRWALSPVRQLYLEYLLPGAGHALAC